MVKCDLCGKKVKENEIYGFYPEDSSFICKKCFGKNIRNNENLKCAVSLDSKAKEGSEK